jgi:phage gpG-like protein
MSDFIVSVDSTKFQNRLLGIQGTMRTTLLRVMQRLAIELQTHVKEDKLSGQVLHNKTGTLRRSINQRVDEEGDTFVARVGTNVKYAGIHEFGGTIPSHVVQAKNAQALRFAIGGDFIFRKSVVIPDVQMPERSFLRSALADITPQIKAEIAMALKESIK